jgi:hypothetical protein
MPIGRYIAWVGASLVALLFVADWCLPKSLPEPARDAINRPVIRIASIRQPPERMVIDTSQPTIVPSLTLVKDAVPDEPSPLQSYASTTPLRQSSTLIKKSERSLIGKDVRLRLTDPHWRAPLLPRVAAPLPPFR